MKTRFWVGIVSMVLVSTFYLTSCGTDIQSIREHTTVAETSETVPTSTTTQVTTPTATPTATPTKKPTPTATPTPIPVSKVVIEVDPWTSVNNLSESERYVMYIDWDRDGVTDELSIEKIAPYDKVLVCFRNGQDSSSVEMPVSLFEAHADRSYLNVKTDTISLAQTKDGDFVLFVGENIDTVLDCSEPAASGVFRYDVDRGISVTVVEGVFDCEEQSLYASGWSRKFNGIFTVKSEIVLFDDLSFERVSETQYFLNSYEKFVTSSQDLNIEVEGTSGYSKSVLSAGSVIVPEKEELDSKGNGYLYFQLSDGSKARVKSEYRSNSEETVSLIDGKPDSEAFLYTIGG